MPFIHNGWQALNLAGTLWDTTDAFGRVWYRAFRERGTRVVISASSGVTLSTDPVTTFSGPWPEVERAFERYLAECEGYDVTYVEREPIPTS